MYEKKRLGIWRPYGHSKLKIPLCLKLTWILILVATLQVSASTFTQKISVKGKQIALASLLKEVQQKSGLNVFDGQGLVSPQAKLDVDFQHVEAIQILREVLPQFDLDYKMMDKSIVLIRKEEKKESLRQTNILTNISLQ